MKYKVTILQVHFSCVCVCVKVLVTCLYPTVYGPMDCRQPFPPAGDLPDPGIKSGHPALQVDSLLSEPPGKPMFQLVSYLVTTSTIKIQNIQSPQKVPWGSSLPIPENTGQLSLTIG